MEAGWFRILALGLHCAWAVPGRYLNVTAPFAVGKMVRSVSETEPYKSVLLSQEKVQYKSITVTKWSVVLGLCAGAAAVKVNPLSQVIGLLQDLHTKTDCS